MVESVGNWTGLCACWRWDRVLDTATALLRLQDVVIACNCMQLYDLSVIYITTAFSQDSKPTSNSGVHYQPRGIPGKVHTSTHTQAQQQIIQLKAAMLGSRGCVVALQGKNGGMAQ